ncbi:hypothetical protein IWX77_001664 [Cryobacterium sp. CAN_C2]
MQVDGNAEVKRHYLSGGRFFKTISSHPAKGTRRWTPMLGHG